MLNAAVLEPVGTETVAGMVRLGLAVDSDIVIPPEPAGLVRPTIQVADTPEEREPAAQLRELRAAGARMVRAAAWELPLRLAVTLAPTSDVVAPAVAVNVAAVAPAKTVSEPGTDSAALLLANATVAPPVFDTVTAQVDAAPDARLAGVQLSPVTVTGGDVSATAKLL